MKIKIIHSIMLLSAMLILVASCDKTETFDDRWKLANEAQFAKIAANPEYTKINSQSANGFIMYKMLKEGDGASPFFNSKVKVLYTGWYKNDWSQPDSYTNDKGNLIQNRIVFDTTGDQNPIPRTYTVGQMIDGFSTALQHMQVGDKWEIWIPWKLGYDEAGNNSIPGYTTLVFEIELVEVIEE